MSQVTYDQEVDILYVELIEGPAARQVFLDDLRIIDIAEDETVLGIEFIGASEGVDLSRVPSAPLVRRLIEETGLSIPVHV